MGPREAVVMKPSPLLLLGILLLVSSGCPTTEPPTDDDDVYEGVVIVEIVPADGTSDFLFTSSLHVRFESPADAADADLATAAGDPVGAAVALSADGLELLVDPFVPLEPSTDYLWTLTFAPSSTGTLDLAFRTDVYGAPLEVDASGLLGRTYRVMVESEDLTDPPGAGAVIATYLTETPVLLAVTEPSSFDEGDQPGLSLTGAIGMTVDGVVLQNPCRGTTSLSAGEDGEVGTTDDTLSSWEDPVLQIGPYHLPLDIGGVLAGIHDLDLRWVVHPALNDWEDGTFSGTVDTRWLDDLGPGSGEPGSTCELLSAVGLPCEECPAGDPGAFCIDLRAEGLSGVEAPEVVLTPRDCADVIALHLDTGECADDVADFDPAGDGSYPFCPEWTD